MTATVLCYWAAAEAEEVAVVVVVLGTDSHAVAVAAVVAVVISHYSPLSNPANYQRWQLECHQISPHTNSSCSVGTTKRLSTGRKAARWLFLVPFFCN